MPSCQFVLQQKGEEFVAQWRLQPDRPDLATVEQRLETFQHWPEQASHTPLALAEAGFHYTGSGEEVR